MSSKDIFENVQFSKEGPNKTTLTEMSGYSVLRLSLGKGARASPHIATHSAFFFVLKGRAIIISGDAEFELGENQYITVKAHQMRSIQALEDLVILVVKDWNISLSEKGKNDSW
jgi:mannose-6-phosphate isomerase-like protein (cupin superfamily)